VLLAGLTVLSAVLFFFFFNDTATTEIYTLSLHDALPILRNDDARSECKRSSQTECSAGEAPARSGNDSEVFEYRWHHGVLSLSFTSDTNFGSAYHTAASPVSTR